MNNNTDEFDTKLAGIEIFRGSKPKIKELKALLFINTKEDKINPEIIDYALDKAIEQAKIEIASK